MLGGGCLLTHEPYEGVGLRDEPMKETLITERRFSFPSDPLHTEAQVRTCFRESSSIHPNPTP